MSSPFAPRRDQTSMEGSARRSSFYKSKNPINAAYPPRFRPEFSEVRRWREMREHSLVSQSFLGCFVQHFRSVHQPAKLRLLADRLEIAVVIDDIQAVAVPQRGREKLKGPKPVCGVLTRGQGIDIGCLIKRLWAFALLQRFFAVLQSGVALAL